MAKYFKVWCRYKWRLFDNSMIIKRWVRGKNKGFIQIQFADRKEKVLKSDVEKIN